MSGRKKYVTSRYNGKLIIGKQAQTASEQASQQPVAQHFNILCNVKLS